MTDFNSIPPTIRQADTTIWSGSWGNYPSSAWSATVTISGSVSRAVAGEAQGDDSFLFTLTPTLSSGLKGGTYAASTRVSSGSLQYTVDSQRISVVELVDPVTKQIIQLEKYIEQLEAVQQNHVADGFAPITISSDTRTLTLRSLEDVNLALTDARNRLYKLTNTRSAWLHIVPLGI